MNIPIEYDDDLERNNADLLQLPKPNEKQLNLSEYLHAGAGAVLCYRSIVGADAVLRCRSIVGVGTALRFRSIVGAAWARCFVTNRFRKLKGAGAVRCWCFATY